MPVYIVHGFRWPREGFTGIRVHAIVHNLEDCSVEYIQNENSREELLGSFRKNYEDIMKDLESSGRTLDFIEQYDPEDVESSSAVSQPYAYVADKVVELAGQTVTQPQSPKEKSKTSSPLLSVNVEDVIANGPGLTTRAWEALAELRDKIATGEKIGWWVVYNGDPERAYDSEEDADDEDEEEEEASTPTAETTPDRILVTPGREATTPVTPSRAEAGPPVPPKSSTQSLSSKLLPNRSKPDAVKPEAMLQSPKDEKIAEPPKLKEVAKTSGFRKKFFGKKL